MLLGQLVADRRGMIWGLTISLGINACIYFFGHRRLLNIFPLVRLEGQDPWGLLPLVEKLAVKAGVAVPEVYLTPLWIPTTWSAGHSWRTSKIILSEGLIRELPLEQIAASVAFELARIRRHDTLAIGMAVGIASCVTFPFRFLQAHKFKHPIVSSVAAMTAKCLQWALQPVSAFLVRCALSRNDVYSADKETSELIGQSNVWGETLWNIASFSHRYQLPVEWGDAAAFTMTPISFEHWTRLLDPQPHPEDRIFRLLGRFPV